MKCLKVLFIILFFLCVNPVFAYEPETTHAGITEQAVLFYNKNFSRKISDVEKELVISGAIAEDYPNVRVLNHFYDPERKIGIYNYRTSKDWATDPLTENQYTWPAAIKKYAEGDDKNALIYLGHILHLIEDLTVPDHTRNDPHVGDPLTGGSSYETWASKNKNRTTMNGLSDNYSELSPVIYNNILEYFDFLAGYSNNNFFGDDSIQNNVYQYDKPEIIEKNNKYGFGIDNIFGGKFPIVGIKIISDGTEQLSLVANNDYFVLFSYFTRLSKQAILGGAGVIDLFFREAEKARADYLATQKLKLEAEAVSVAALSRKLNNAGPISRALYDLQGLVSENIIDPFVSSASSLGSGLVNRSIIVAKEISNLENFVAFTLNVITTEAYAETSSSIKSGYNKIISSLQNIGSAVSATTDKNPASVSVAPVAPVISNSELGNPISKLDSVIMADDNQLGHGMSKLEVMAQAEMVDSLNKAMVELQNLRKIALVQSAAENSQLATVVKAGTPSPANAYVAGFGGGGELPALKVVDNLGNTQNTVDLSSENSDDTTTDETVGDLPTPDLSNNEQASSYTIDEEQASSTTDLEILFPSEDEEATSTENVATTTEEIDIDGETATSTDEVATSTEEVLEEEEKEEEEVEVDTTAPDISMEVKECADSMLQDGCLLATTTLNIFWSSSASDLDHFEIDVNGSVSSTSAGSAILSPNNGDRINISAIAIDKSGNRSEKAEKVVEINLSPVVINEIAWNGTSGHSEDEWIELYNKTEKAISLDGWTLYSKTDNSPNIKLSGTIAPNGYYLIERKNTDEMDELTQSPIKDIPADLWVSFGTGLNNLGENLLLARASTTIDEVPFDANWYGEASKYKTYERYSPESAVKTTSWTENNGEIRNGKNVDGAIINGTPKARNSANYLIPRSSAVNGKIELKKKNSPYFVPSDTNFEIYFGETLTLNPGVVLKFGKNSLMKATGNLITKGTAEDPVVFTSISDDEFGGDTNGDGVCDKTNASSTAVCPAPGNWPGVWVMASSTDANIENTIFRYGGAVMGAKRAMVDVEKVSPKISGSTFEYALTDGLYLDRTNSVLSGNIFRNNNKVTNSIPASIGLKISGGTLNITENKFINNSVGLFANGSFITIKDNEFSGNSVKMADLSNVNGGEISGNKTSDDLSAQYPRDMINLSLSLSSPNSTTTLGGDQIPYFISGTTKVFATSTLEIKEGAKMIFSNSGSAGYLYVEGRMIVSGTIEKPVIFTNSDYFTKNSWSGINMNAGSRAEIKGAIFKNAMTAITYVKSPIILEDTTFLNNKLGISANSLSVVLKALNVIFENNTTNTSPAKLW